MATIGSARSLRRSRQFPLFSPTQYRQISQLTGLKEPLKTVDELPGYQSYFGLGFSRLINQGLRATILPPEKPLGKIVLELQERRLKKFGPIHRVNFPGVKVCVNLADPLAMAEVLRNESKYPVRIAAPAMDYYREQRKAIAGVFFANGEDWYRYRSTVSKRILRPKDIADYGPVLNEISTDFIVRLNGLRKPDNEIQNLENELFKWVFESVSSVLFERRFGCLEEGVNADAQGFIDSIAGFLAYLYEANLLPMWFYKIYETKAYKNMAFHLDNMYMYADQFINEKLQEIKHKEKIGQYNENERSGFMEYLIFNHRLSREDLTGCMIDLLFAGIDTTTHAMQWFLYMMSKNPAKQEKLLQEILMVLPCGKGPSAQIIAQMPYLKACFKETFRLYPILSQTGRITPTDMDVLGYHIPKGTQMIFLHYHMGRSDKYFSNPNDFIPERWMENSEGLKRPGTTQAFASIPFGFGTRMCAGRRIAELELYILATKLTQMYRFEYPENEVVEPFMKSITTPDRPLRVKFIPRK